MEPTLFKPKPSENHPPFFETNTVSVWVHPNLDRVTEKISVVLNRQSARMTHTNRKNMSIAVGSIWFERHRRAGFASALSGHWDREPNRIHGMPTNLFETNIFETKTCRSQNFSKPKPFKSKLFKPKLSEPTLSPSLSKPTPSVRVRPNLDRITQEISVVMNRSSARMTHTNQKNKSIAVYRA